MSSPAPSVGEEPDTPDRRRVRTRTALINAAQDILADDARGDVTIKEITDTAEVEFGSFYNHFETKTELFDAAVVDMLDKQGALIEEVTANLDDPAEGYIVGLRLTGRLSRTYPRLAKLLINTGLSYVTGDIGITPTALQHLHNAISAGRLERTIRNWRRQPLGRVARTCPIHR